ncbi:MAG TPA: isochorismatase family cysteine hydrolase [Solirubrobacteraceae bacterium]|jgi:nicotinamidase-related amidase
MPTTALLVIDMLSTYDHEDADVLAESAAAAVPEIRALLDRAGEDTLVVYINDNFEAWEASREQLLEQALKGKRPDLIEPIAPGADMPFLAKGRHSVFYQTALDHLLRARDIERLVMTGQATEQCILYSALDAYLRGFQIVIPTDAVAHIDDELAEAAIEMMRRNMSAEIVRAEACDLVGAGSPTSTQS